MGDEEQNMAQPPARKWDTFTLIHTNNTASSWAQGRDCVLTLTTQNNVQPSAVISYGQLCSAVGVVVMRGDVAMGRMGRGHIVQAQ